MGAHVMVTARREKRLQEVVQKCLDLGASSAQYVAADMSNLTAAQKVMEETKDALGGLDHLILNHVGLTFQFGPFQRDVEIVIKTMTINFFSYVQLTILALDMLQDSHGSIIVVSSMSGRVPSPFAVPYGASKSALEGFYSSLRTELRLMKAELPVTIAVLGYIDTDMAMNAIGDKTLMSPSSKEECAREIVKGGMLRQREVFYPYWSTKPPLLLRDWMPEFLEYLIGKAYVVENII
ncbi:hydroxysteroid 11-beta-dehydrogenase 1-like protein A isoform X2 [Sceloporus undulatus]|nr:hydroxysteroid 11-beta-dehydrogenase 1-like protein A isoform X2 [Sceloporus undulatus]